MALYRTARLQRKTFVVFEPEEKKTYCKMIKYRKNIQRMQQANEDKRRQTKTNEDKRRQTKTNEDKRRQTKTSVLGEEFKVWPTL